MNSVSNSRDPEKWETEMRDRLTGDVAPVRSWKPPLWRGVNLKNMFRINTQFADGFREELFCWLHDWGFNFARLPLDYRFFMEGETLLEEGLRRLDDAVIYGRKHKIHIQISLHLAPGFVIMPLPDEPRDLHCNPESQRKFIRLWRTFAERYAGIPNEELSFNPLNEPQGFSTEQYVQVFGETLLAIRQADPERFVMLDGNHVASTPVPFFFDIKSTGQAFRGYTPHALSHYAAPYISQQPKCVPGWPCTPGAEDNPQDWIWEQPEVTLEKFAWVKDLDYPVMIGEFGCFNKTPHDVCLAWMEHCLKLWKEKELSWAIWNLNGVFGFLDSERDDVEYEDFQGHKLDRKMLDLLQKYF